jgi:hypothetical protein
VNYRYRLHMVVPPRLPLRLKLAMWLILPWVERWQLCRMDYHEDAE